MSKIGKRGTVMISDLLQEYLRAEHLTSALNTRRIFSAWDDASGAGKYTVRKYFRDGNLYITVSSSVVRSQLYYQKDALIGKMNSILEQDGLFSDNDAFVGYVKDLILK